jgi:penicillin-binding protein A
MARCGTGPATSSSDRDPASRWWWPAAAFESGEYSPESLFDDPVAFQLPGSTATISNFGDGLCGDGGQVSLEVAFIRSCNTVFADLAIQLGAEQIGRTAEALGFSEPIRMPWDTTAPSSPPVSSKRTAALGQSGIGERDVRATPLQMAMVASAIANGGEMMSPRVVTQLFDADGETVEAFAPRSLGSPLSVASADVLTEMMERVVTEGTGRQAAIRGVRVAGKTGTAQGVDAAPDVWFIGFAPVDDPAIAIAVMVEDGGESGGAQPAAGWRRPSPPP